MIVVLQQQDTYLIIFTTPCSAAHLTTCDLTSAKIVLIIVPHCLSEMKQNKTKVQNTSVFFYLQMYGAIWVYSKWPRMQHCVWPPRRLIPLGYHTFICSSSQVTLLLNSSICVMYTTKEINKAVLGLNQYCLCCYVIPRISNCGILIILSKVLQLHFFTINST